MNGLAGLAAGRIGCKRVHQQNKTAALVVKVFGGIIGSHLGETKIWIFDGIWHKMARKKGGIDGANQRHRSTTPSRRLVPYFRRKRRPEWAKMEFARQRPPSRALSNA
jgi:hypothetical protein